MTRPSIANRDEWIRARRNLLSREKDLTRQLDALAAERRRLPWVRVQSAYTFEGPEGRVQLSDMFGPASQLVIYHFMFGPDWPTGCKACSFWSDHFSSMRAHLAARDVQLVAVSRAPRTKLRAFAERMGWSFPWYSSEDGAFNYDFAVAFSPEQLDSGERLYNYGSQKPHGRDVHGLSVFARHDDAIYHTYSTYARGVEMLNSTYQLLDLTPKGRDEDELEFTMSWLRLHDDYT